MLRLNNRVRFTDAEAEKMLRIGINLYGVRTQSDINEEFARWANALALRCPGLLEKIAHELAKVVQQVEPAYGGDNLEPGW